VTVVHPGGVRTNIARSAKLAAALDPAQAAEGLDSIERLLRLDPAQAAQIILEAAQQRRPRVLVGSDARTADLLVRLLPGTYWRVIGALLAR
jgi:hypothetical protein